MEFWVFQINLKIIGLMVMVIVGSILIQFFLNFNYKHDIITKVPVFNNEQLKTFNGIDSENIYIAVMGEIFDVTAGRKYYGIGNTYNYFVGKDGTRALVTGDFKDASFNKDHVLDLSCENIISLLHWGHTFREKYIFIGVLSGRYYDENGEETKYTEMLKEKVKQCQVEKDEAKKQKELFPPCNIAWSEAHGTRVWCTKSSGGVTRSWEGVPRQQYLPGKSKPHCVCVSDDKLNNSLLKVYDNCDLLSTQCLVQDK